ncbi:hypothetical protein TYRP_012705 [Tyrophagus putrescentiae]|nr:hypothetical protein TYRP_012705 [Tyrophagus putrescentiae]
MDTKSEKRLERIKNTIRTYVNFPKEGIVFRDVFPLFQDPWAPSSASSRAASSSGPTLALRLGLPFVPVRKAGKLPGKVVSAAYQLEYGSDRFELQESSITPAGLPVVIVDDLLATGGSLKTAIKLVEQCGGTVRSAAVVIELADLAGRKQVSSPVFALVQY